MKLYRVNQVSAENGTILKTTDMLASDDRDALRAVAETHARPSEVWREGKKVGSVS